MNSAINLAPLIPLRPVLYALLLNTRLNSLRYDLLRDYRARAYVRIPVLRRSPNARRNGERARDLRSIVNSFYRFETVLFFSFLVVAEEKRGSWDRPFIRGKVK